MALQDGMGRERKHSERWNFQKLNIFVRALNILFIAGTMQSDIWHFGFVFIALPCIGFLEKKDTPTLEVFLPKIV